MDARYKFCPKCANLLVTESSATHTGAALSDAWKRVCMTCPYFQIINRKHCYPVFIKVRLDFSIRNIIFIV